MSEEQIDRKEWLPILREMVERYEVGDISQVNLNCPLCAMAEDVAFDFGLGVEDECEACPWWWFYEEKICACEKWGWSLSPEHEGTSLKAIYEEKPHILQLRIAMLKDWINQIEAGE